jgi:hypothetical protein
VEIGENLFFSIHKLQYFAFCDEKAIARKAKKAYDRNITINDSLVERGGPYEG